MVCAIEDPGIPFFQKQLTILGQNLRQADITNTNISEVLRIYLTARGQAEVKLMHNRNPPEMLHAKDPRRILEDTPENIQDYNEVLKKTKGKILKTLILTLIGMRADTFISLSCLDQILSAPFWSNIFKKNQRWKLTSMSLIWQPAKIFETYKKCP